MANSRCVKSKTGAPMSAFSKNILQRCIYVENYNIAEFSSKAKEIADSTNMAIQKISLISSGRQLPFISLQACKGSYIKKSARVLLKGLDSDYLGCHERVQENMQSYLVEFQISAGYKQITFSNIDCDAKLVLDDKYLRSAIVDMFLDSSMFNSFSFLRNMSLEEKKRFSKEKYEFFKKKNLKCDYTCDEEDEFMYYSLAFSAHEDNGKLDLETYLALWDEFLKEYYSGAVHEEESIERQLSKHVYNGQLDISSILTEFCGYSRGDYLLLLTNRKSKGKNAVRINAIFGDGAGHLKAWKIVPVSAYNTYAELIQNAYIAAFKIVN